MKGSTLDIKELFNMSDRTYELLKWFVQIFIPALVVFYGVLAGFWGFPNPEAVMGTMSAVALFIGASLKISSANYEAPTDGALNIDESDPMKDTYSFDLQESLFDLSDGDVVSFRVNHTPPTD